MAVDERRRRELFDELSQLLGADMASALFEHLPPAREDVATVQQVEDLGAEMEQRFDLMEQRFDQLDGRFDRIDERFDRIDERFTRIAGRFDRVDERSARTDGRFDRVDGHLQSLEENLEADLDSREERLADRLTAAWRRDLLIHSTGQVFALAAAVAALVGLG